MKNLNDRFWWWLGRALFIAWIALSFAAEHLFGGFVADVISGRLSVVTGIHEGDVETAISTHLIIFIVIGVLILIPYAIGRSKAVSELLPKQFSNTSASHHRYVTVAEAIRYIADESKWGERKRAQPPNERGMYEHPRFAAIDEFARAASEGEIGVLGRANGAGEHQQIAQPYWLYHTVNPMTVFDKDQAGSTTPNSRVRLEAFTLYDMLTVDQSEVSRVWPRLQQRGRLRFWPKQFGRTA